MPILRSRTLRWGAAVLLGAAVAMGAVAWYLGGQYSLPPARALTEGARVAAADLLAFAYSRDLATAAERRQGYLHGRAAAEALPPHRWAELAQGIPGLTLRAEREPGPRLVAPAFVYESADAPQARALRERYGLDRLVAGAPTEYDAILRLANWVGTRFDHGIEEPPGGWKACDPVAIVESGAAGGRYWCEVAAATMVQAATAAGFPARLITVSRDGYTAEHGVAELWSNEHGKWFVVDTDLNLVYERQGVPLSARDLVEYGAAWRDAGEITKREIAPRKPNLPVRADEIQLYRYVHVDLRSDWCTRPLRRGSPAGGDRSTLWFATREAAPLLTARRRASPEDFDWPLNRTDVEPLELRREGDVLRARVALSAYGPTVTAFQVRVDDGDWQTIDGDEYALTLPVGSTVLQARVQTRSGYPGPVTRVPLRVSFAG
jgi:hypothetical protein